MNYPQWLQFYVCLKMDQTALTIHQSQEEAASKTYK
jgi:hypothetical protein